MSSDRLFVATSAVLFAASAVATIRFCSSMSGGMLMPGRWTMSMTWMSMPGQTRAAAFTYFVAMWTVMMVAMMLPSLVPMLWSYRRCLRAAGENRLGVLTLVCSLAYFLVWASFGAVAYTVGVTLAGAEMHSPRLALSVPLLSAVLLIVAGAIQLSPWKIQHLQRCRLAAACVGSLPERARNAAVHGARLGLRCALCCAGFMLVLLVVGTMDLAAMLVLCIAITVERMAARPAFVARAAGIVIVAAGVLAIARALRAG